jgi:cysteine desulfurase
LKLPVYFDHAATTPILPEVLDMMMPYFTTHYGNASSRHHAFGWLSEEAISEAKTTISQSLACDSNHIIFTSGATEAINTVLFGFADVNPSGHIISLQTEHKATLECLDQLEKTGFSVSYLKVNSNGELNLNELENLIKSIKKPVLLSLLWVNNETGLVHPIDEITELKKRLNFQLHLDATQAVGKILINLTALDIDYFTYSAHKIYGPKGIGALIAKKEISKRIFGGSQQRNQRGGTLNTPLVVGMAKATELAFQNLKKYINHTSFLQKTLENALLGRPECFSVNSNGANRISNISNIAILGQDSESLIQKISHQYAISNGSACNAANTLPSHVLKAMGQADQEAFSAIRLSFGWENTENQVLDFVEKIKIVALP